MKWFNPSALIAALVLLAACASSPFVSTWQAPDAQPLHVTGSRVAAVVMNSNEGSRRAAEDALARELSARGAIGIPLYSLVPDASPDNEASVKEALVEAGVAGVVVMRPVGAQTKVSSTPAPYHGPRYAGFWGGYYGHGWGAPYSEIRTDTIVYIETLVYSLKQNKLVWAGESKTTNPSNIDRLVRDTAKKVADELQQLGLIAAD